MELYTFALPTDHFQFYVEDHQPDADTATIWDDNAQSDRVAVRPGLIAVGTVRFGGLTTVELAFVEECPAYSTADWDHIVHCSIALETGEIVLHSPELEYGDAPRMVVEPGNYQVLVFFARLDSFDDEMETAGDDRYRLVFWPGSLIAPYVIKQWVPASP